MLLALVFGIFLVLIGVTASALVAVASTHLSTTAINAILTHDRDLVELFVEGNLRTTDVSGEALSPTRATTLRGQMDTLASEDGITAIALHDVNGDLVVSGGPAATELETGMDEALLAAAQDRHEPQHRIEEPSGPTHPFIDEHLPIMADGELRGVITIRRDATDLLASLDAARRDIMIVTLAAAAVLAAILYFVFRAAQTRLTRQQHQLVEATRRDALTGMLNHGAVVAHIAEAVDTARAKARHITVALIDIDNFRLFNDTHGHESGDAVLLLVADLVSNLESEATISGRYGPDEFVAVWDHRAVSDVERYVRQLASSLREVGVQFGGSEELPVSVSVGIASFPDDATSVTDLLSEASVALARAKASGGDAVALAKDDDREKVAAGSFDVLQGLVIAVDTKDRYTKRHSEDVARYAVFLARQMGLDEEMLDTIHLAGLLHDIGKIGIPDALLRKPGKLTEEEYAVFQQHVALGDAIVRDVPHVELVRAGIKHHHERWDGDGYLEGLEGEAIPIVGRVLAVADAFSAMTTTRPYRKALPIEEALKRLGDAAGTQLQEELVTCFINGIETAADAPLPGEKTSTAIWRPQRMVA
jgi:diguanylate cyclase (GGDEF)-like protein